ncbi:MAG: Delta(1)-pyrroline-2-carboxylate reductase [Anaerolineales bacterium]|nr:Delta(1)-pyrroline-2-carboxylate reductase [Anaerolineales bacterium]
MLILTADEVRQALPMREAIEAMKHAYASLSDGKADAPLRTRLAIPPHNGLALFMPAYVQTQETEALAVKIVSIHPQNPKRGLPYIHAAVVVLEADTGRALALLEGGALTAIRTGAGSGAAIDLLARADSKTLAVFGAGKQGRTQLEAACAVREIESVWVFNTSRERAEIFAAEMAGRGRIPKNLRVAASPAQAAKDADIICTATTSTHPVFADADIKPGTHISAIGSYTPEMQEVPAQTVARAKVVVDSRSAALAESGDLLQPMQEGLFDESHIYAELGEIALGQKNGRTAAGEITYFKSVGIAVQDALAAQLALNNAGKLGLGQRVDF